MPTPEMLSSIRQEIDYNPDDLIKVIDDSDFKESFGEIRGEKLKMAPKGYAKDHENIDLLRLKNYYILKEFSDAEVSSKEFVSVATQTFRKVKQFNDYLSLAIS